MKSSFLIIAALVFGSLAQANPSVCLNDVAADASRRGGSQEQIVKDLIKQNKDKALTELDWSERGDFVSPANHRYDSPLVNNIVPEKMRGALLLNGAIGFSVRNENEIPDNLMVANVRHHEEIYIAEIPWKKIASIEIQKQQMSVVESSSPGAAEINNLVAHARIKFIFEEGFSARLTHKVRTDNGEILIEALGGSNNNVATSPVISLPSISLSAEALTSKYDFAKGADEKYAFGHFFQAESVPEGIHRAGGGALTPIPMTGLSEADKKNIFLEALITSQLHDKTCDEIPKYKNTYNLVSNNCIAATFNVLERAGFERGSCPRDKVDEFLDAIPPMSADAPPSQQMIELFGLLEQAGVQRATAMRVAGALNQAKTSGDVWVATRIQCWLNNN